MQSLIHKIPISDKTPIFDTETLNAFAGWQTWRWRSTLHSAPYTHTHTQLRAKTVFPVVSEDYRRVDYHQQQVYTLPLAGVPRSKETPTLIGSP